MTTPKESLMWHIAQGDLLLCRVATKPSRLTTVPAETGRLILARGEATGHHHSVPDSVGVLELDEGGVMFLTIDQLTAVTHQEHAPVTLEPGTYEVRRQREWTDADEPRYVGD